MAIPNAPCVYLIFFVICCVVCVVVGEIRELQSGFILRHFANTGVVSVQCNCQRLPRDTRTVLSVSLKQYVSTSKSLPVASLYPHGKSIVNTPKATRTSHVIFCELW